MSDMARVDRIMTEVAALGEQEKALLFQRVEQLIDTDEDDEPIGSAFGLWKDRDITLESIRKKAWRKN